jgi:hypothetical protein
MNLDPVLLSAKVLYVGAVSSSLYSSIKSKNTLSETDICLQTQHIESKEYESKFILIVSMRFAEK